jgi:ankyrin repeat protein
MVAEMSPWVPVVVAVLLVCLVAAAFSLALLLVARLRRRICARRGKIKPNSDWAAFVVAARQIKHGDLVALRQSFASGLRGDLQDRFGNDLLMVAAQAGNVPVGELLIANGADVNYVAPSGWAAVRTALYYGHVRFLELLLEHGADPDRRRGAMTIEDDLQRSGFEAKKAEAVRVLLRYYRARQHAIGP